MTHGPEFAIDYPALDPDLWVIWSAEPFVWPDPRRNIYYLSDRKVHTLGGFAFHTTIPEYASTFSTEHEAQAFFTHHQELRLSFSKQGYGPKNITTVRELIERQFPQRKS